MLIDDFSNAAEVAKLRVAGYGNPKLIFDMRNWEGMMDPRAADSVTAVSRGTEVRIGVEITSQFTAFNSSSGICGTKSLTYCALYDCLTAARMAADNCWPLAGNTLTQSIKPDARIPTCGKRFSNGQISEVVNLGQTNAYRSAWEQCLFHNCTVSPCLTTEYGFVRSLTNVGLGVNATLYQAKMTYNVLKEYATMDFYTFLAIFGGIISKNSITNKALYRRWIS